MKRVDDWLQERARRSAHAVQRCTGLTSVHLCRLAAGTALCGDFVDAWDWWQPGLLAFDSTVVWATLDHGAVAVWFYFLHLLRQAGQWTGGPLPSVLALSRSVFPTGPFRAGLALLAVFPLVAFWAMVASGRPNLFFEAVSDVSGVGFVCLCYWIWVDPLPPAAVRALKLAWSGT